MIVMMTIKSFLVLALHQVTFESNCFNNIVLTILFVLYWVCVIASAVTASKTSLASWFTVSNVLSVLSSILIFIVFNRAVGSGFKVYLDDLLVAT